MRFAWIALGAVAVAVGGCSGGVPGEPEPTESTSEALQQCESASVEGVDVYDGTGTIDWNAVKGAGVDFALIKATQGTYNTQASFKTNWNGAKAAGVYPGAYHFFDPTEDGVAQAQHFLSVLGTLGPGDLPAMLDIECPDGDPNCLYKGASGAAAASDIHTRMWDWIHTVEQATGRKPIIYTFGSYFSSNGIDTTGLGPYPLYIADIVSGSCFNVPSPWTAAVIWQYSWTGTVAGISGQVDRDKFIGTLADLQNFANPATSADAGADGGGEGGVGGDAGADAGSGPDAEAVPDTGAGVVGADGSIVASDAPAADAGGCGCRVVSTDDTDSGALVALPLAFVAAAARRRRIRGSRDGTRCAS